ncbi:hypothetical protein AKJ08_2973 [Vulgatibacter incomptus]|uniref:Uncharacterized protein n=1 Tax=Vulgatibacter incomptus TaxID=1391653 RepID=A0A0K1PGN9_9BACT|nr:hypothetical protein AKJ08_2973 [Vulgatibacter incomptus]
MASSWWMGWRKGGYGRRHDAATAQAGHDADSRRKFGFARIILAGTRTSA